MTFREWVDDIGGPPAAAARLGESLRTVQSWYYLQRAPHARAARNIVTVSGGAVDYNAIFEAYAAARDSASQEPVA